MSDMESSIYTSDMSHQDLLHNTQDGCTWELCHLSYAYFEYRPNRAANLAFAVLFGISMLAYLGQGIFSKKWIGFTVAMVGGCVLEMIGYAGRVAAYKDLWHERPFLIQICCLTIAPAFLAAGLYLSLSRIVETFGAENSRIKPIWYPRIFITCDFFSLVLQAAGGGIASVKTHNDEDPKMGNNIMIAGLSFQVATLFVFILLALDFSVCTIRRIRAFGTDHALDPRHARLRNSRPFQGFLVALTLATLLIFTRCVFRVAELSEGWEGRLMKKQGLFIGLEGVVIVLAVYLLNFFHPGLCFKESRVETSTQASAARSSDEKATGSGAGRTWCGMKKKAVSPGSSMENIKA